MRRIRALFVVVGCVCLVAARGMAFEPPGAAERQRAVGSTQELPGILRRAFDPWNDFQPIARPKPNDWLATQREDGQSFADFQRAKPHRPDGTRSRLYLQRLGDFPKDRSPAIDRLVTFATAFFGVQVVVLPPITTEASTITTRLNPYTRRPQMLTDDLLQILRRALPADGFCVLGITMLDLYPDPAWNFVFGEASLRARVGVYSFARYDPAFYGAERGQDYESILLRRSCKVLAHETSHMFGMEHCIYFECLMNGSNHLQETDARPLHLCPVCLRKLQSSVGFNVGERYQALASFAQAAGWEDEAQWFEHRRRWVAGEPDIKPPLLQESGDSSLRSE